MAIKNNVKILVIIPAYNEEQSLPSVIEKIGANPIKTDIVVINDSSSDQTHIVAEKEGVLVVNLCTNLGIGGAVQTGFKYAQLQGYDIAIQVDADGQHNPDQIPQLIQPILDNKADMVIGSRFLDVESNYTPPVMRQIGMHLFSNITSLIVGHPITDTTSGFRAIGKNLIAFFAQNYPIDFPDSEAIIMVKKAGFKIEEVPVAMNVRQTGKSSINIKKSLYYPLKMIVSILSILIRSIKMKKE
jgi:glycosyltransferase involved in cell wall biosynthesis